MALSLAGLLIHSDAVPLSAREALRAASSGPLERRSAELESAARILSRDAGIDCRDARELVGLPDGDCG